MFDVKIWAEYGNISLVWFDSDNGGVEYEIDDLLALPEEDRNGVAFRATYQDANEAIGIIKYVPVNDWSGTDHIYISVNDLSHRGFAEAGSGRLCCQ